MPRATADRAPHAAGALAARSSPATPASRSTTSARSRTSASSRPSTASTPTAAIAFTSYAVPTILGELKRHFRDRTWAIHMSRGVAGVDRARREGDRGAAPAVRALPERVQVAEHCGMNVEDVTEARLAEHASRMASLDAPVAARGRRPGRTCSGATTPGSRRRGRALDRAARRRADARASARSCGAVRRGPGPARDRRAAVGISQMHVSRVAAPGPSSTSPRRRRPSSAMSSSRDGGQLDAAAGRRSRRGCPCASRRGPLERAQAVVERAPARLDQAVGEQPQRLAGREREAPERAGCGAAEPERRAARRVDVAAAGDQRRQVAGAGQLALAAARVEHDVDDGDERDRARGGRDERVQVVDRPRPGRRP